MFSLADSASPSLLASGDRVRWQAVARPLYDEIEAAARAGGAAFDRASLLT
jgi:hypothetical protein